MSKAIGSIVEIEKDIQPQRNRIVTISQRLDLSWAFDDEVNEFLEEGWKINRIETVINSL